jgi:hypothetical protein
MTENISSTFHFSFPYSSKRVICSCYREWGSIVLKENCGVAENSASNRSRGALVQKELLALSLKQQQRSRFTAHRVPTLHLSRAAKLEGDT